MISNAAKQLMANWISAENAPISVNPAFGVVAGQEVDVLIATECALAGKATAKRLRITARIAKSV